VIFAGNRAKRDEVAGILAQGGKEVFLADNVMPEFGVLDVVPTSAVVRELFLSRITQAKGVKAAESLVDGVIMPTPTAVLKGAELLSRGTKAIAGIGNIYACEILHGAGISPVRQAAMLGDYEWKKIFSQARRVLKKAIAKRGTSISDWRDLYGCPGENQNELQVYGREGTTCCVCKEVIVRIKQGGRSTFYCPRCQK